MARIATLRSFQLVAAAVLAFGIAFLTARAETPPVPPAKAIETDDLASRAGGCVVMSHPVGGIDAVQLRTLETIVVRQARVGRPAILAVSGPDEEGRIAFLEEDSSARRYSLKTIRLDGGGEAEIFTRPGSALWDHAIDGLVLAPRGGHVASLAQQPASRKRFAPAITVGELEIWDLAAKTGGEAGIAVLNWRMSWFPDGKRLVYAQTNEGGQPVPVKVLNVESGQSDGWPTRAAMAVSTDGRTALINLGRAGYAKLDVAAETSTPTSVPRDFHGDWVRGPLALIGDDVLLYRANPPRDVAPKLTENNSPLVGPKPMLSLKLAELSSGRFQTIVADLDPRTSVSFGGIGACR
jgi:hypothetical protein